MATYNVGGLSPFNRAKTIYEALDKALPDDEINWAKSTKHEGALQLRYGIHLIGNKSKFKVPEHSVGLKLNGRGTLILENLNIQVTSLSNGIQISDWVGKIIIKNCEVRYKGKIKEGKAYPLVSSSQLLNNAEIIIENSILDGVYLEAKRIEVINSKINGSQNPCYVGAHLVSISESYLEDTSIESGEFIVNGGQLEKRVKFDGESGSISNLSVGDTAPTVLSIVGDTSIKNVVFNEQNVKELQLSNGKFELSSVTIPAISVISTNTEISIFDNVHDDGYWTKTNTVMSNQTSQEIAHEVEDSAVEQINKLIGLTSVKHTMENYVSMARIAKAREAQGLENMDYSLHLVFSGNPGAGKTVVAEIFAKALYEEGVLPTSKVNKVSREDLIDNIIGGTAIKTRKVIDDSLGGVLFIDEAYSLRSQGERDFANEAVDTLVNAMDAHRKELVVIMAGYTNEMKDFFENGNPGLKSRFSNWVEFPDYTFEELWDIMNLQISDKYIASTEVLDKMKLLLFSFFRKGLVDGNGRFVRNFVQEIVFAQSMRLRNETNLDKETLQTLTVEDAQNGYDKYYSQLVSRNSY